MSSARTIDVHAHYVPDGYRSALLANGHAQPDGFPQIPEWSADEHVATIRRQQPRDHRYGRCLAGTVRAEEADQPPALDRERHVVHGNERSERLAEMSDVQHVT